MTDLRDPKDIMIGDITLAEAIELHGLWLTDENKGTRLSGLNADLSNADLSGAKVTDRQLAQARTLEDATLPDGTKHD